MEWQFVAALVVATPFILIPVVFVWYLNVGGIVAAVRQGQKERAIAGEETRAVTDERPAVTTALPEGEPAAASAVLREQPAATVTKAGERPPVTVVAHAEKLLARR